MKAQQAVRIGGKKAPRRPVQKKVQEINNEIRLRNILSTNKYKAHPMEKIDNCSLISRSGVIVNYPNPEVSTIYHLDNQPVAYLIKGKGEVLNGGGSSNPTLDIDTVSSMLKEKGVDINDLVKKAKEGDKESFMKIIEELKKVSHSE